MDSNGAAPVRERAVIKRMPAVRLAADYSADLETRTTAPPLSGQAAVSSRTSGIGTAANAELDSGKGFLQALPDELRCFRAAQIAPLRFCGAA